MELNELLVKVVEDYLLENKHRDQATVKAEVHAALNYVIRDRVPFQGEVRLGGDRSPIAKGTSAEADLADAARLQAVRPQAERRQPDIRPRGFLS